MKIEKADKEDLAKILELQKLAFTREALLHDDFSIQPMVQKLCEIKEEFNSKIFLKVVSNAEIIGSVRGNMEGTDCWVNKLIVHPAYQNQGIGMSLLLEIENYFHGAEKFKLATSSKSLGNIRLYEKAGYVIVKREKLHDGIDGVYFEKMKVVIHP
jgi:ribosomal protein S18 acetylase RimI-like enzyme